MQNIDIVAVERCSLGKSFTLTITDLIPKDGVTRFDLTLRRLSLLYLSKIYKLLHTSRLIYPNNCVMPWGCNFLFYFLIWNQVSASGSCRWCKQPMWGGRLCLISINHWVLQFYVIPCVRTDPRAKFHANPIERQCFALPELADVRGALTPHHQFQTDRETIGRRPFLTKRSTFRKDPRNPR
jgi:hypothetical protein